MSDIDREMVQVVTLDKDDILVFDVGRLSRTQAEAWLKNPQKLLNYQHINPCLMGLRSGQGLTIIKRPYAKDLQKYSEELWEEDMQKAITEKDEHRRKSIAFSNKLAYNTNQEIENEISRLKELLTKRD
jgi:hypothetical protein